PGRPRRPASEPRRPAREDRGPLGGHGRRPRAAHRPGARRRLRGLAAVPDRDPRPRVHRGRGPHRPHPRPRRRLPRPDGAARKPEGDRAMSTMGYALHDTATMLHRRLKHMARYPSLTLMVIGIPVVFLLLFVYVFGGTLGDGLGGPTGGRDAYVAYVAPGILMMAIAGAVQGTS